MKNVIYQCFIIIGFIVAVQCFEWLDVLRTLDTAKHAVADIFNGDSTSKQAKPEGSKNAAVDLLKTVVKLKIEDYKAEIVDEIKSAEIRLMRKDATKTPDSHPILPAADVDVSYAESIFGVGFDQWAPEMDSEHKPLNEADKLFTNKHYNSKLATILILHDACQNFRSHSVRKITEALKLRNFDVNYNIMMLDFDKLMCETLSIKTGITKFGLVPQLQILGDAIGEFITKGIKMKKIRTSQINMVGLGASTHLAAMTAEYIKKRSREKINSILGLDPPVTLQYDPFNKYCTNNIHIYHTFKLVPKAEPTTGQAHADFVFGGAQRNPECSAFSTGDCFKDFGVGLLVTSLLFPKLFPARSCYDYSSFTQHLCDKKEFTYVSFPPDKSASGSYHLNIGYKFPYGLGLDGIYEHDENSKGKAEVSEPPPPPPPKLADDKGEAENILPSDYMWTSDVKGKVKLQLDPNNHQVANRNPVSVPGLMSRAVARWPNNPALIYKEYGVWKTVTFLEYQQNVRMVAKAFLALGLQKFHGVGIIGFNSPEWYYSCLGAIYAGGLAVGIYTTNNPDAIRHNLDLSKANICVVEDDKQLQKILKIKHSLPHLRAIIQYSGTPTTTGVLSWAELMDLGKKQDNTKLEVALKNIAINECCTLVFTSGTEDKPKAVMLSHDNLTWNAYAATRYMELQYEREVAVSYLPLSHIAAQLTDIYMGLTVGAATAFADKDALKGSIVETFREVRPTAILSVPRVWEKIQEKIKSQMEETKGIKNTVVSWGQEHARQNQGKTKGITFKGLFYNYLVYGKVKDALGLTRAKTIICAAAPISTDIKQYFLSFDITITDSYGMSECSGSHTISKASDYKLGTVGKTVPGAEIKINNPDDNGQGEILIRGRHVFMGYLGDPEGTREAIDVEGWLHTGDIGTLDENGFLTITGRIKELLITAGGENIPPVLIEQTIKKELPIISNAQLIGDRRKFLSILLTLKTEVDPDTGAPKEELLPQVKNWLKERDVLVNTMSDVLEGPQKRRVKELIQEGIDRANAKAVSNAQRVQKFAILPSDFSVATGELGPTMKLKRNVVYEKYADVIESFYTET